MLSSWNGQFVLLFTSGTPTRSGSEGRSGASPGSTGSASGATSSAVTGSATGLASDSGFVIGSAGRVPRQRTTLYGEPPAEQVARSFGAAPLAEPWNPHVSEARLERPRRLVRPLVAR